MTDHTTAPEVAGRVLDLRERALCLHRQAWRALDGGQELTLDALVLEAEADALEETDALRAALAADKPR